MIDVLTKRLPMIFRSTAAFKVYFIGFVLFSSATSFAQLNFENWNGSVDATHFFDFEFRSISIPQNLLNSEGESVESLGDREPTNQLDLSLKFPVVLKKDWQLIGVAGYRNELVFDHVLPGNDDIFQTVFHRFSLSGIYMRELDNDWFLWAGARMNVQTANPVRVQKSVDVSSQLLVGKSWDEGKLALGVTAGRNIFGRATVLPLLMYQHKLSERYSVEAFLPSHITAFRHFNKKHRLFLSAQGANSNYRYSVPRVIEGESLTELTYRRLAIRSLAGYEVMVAGPLGFGIDAGVEIPLRYGIYNQTGRDLLHDYGSGKASPYLGARFFLTIPE